MKSKALSLPEEKAPPAPSIPAMGLAEMAIDPAIGAAGTIESCVTRLGALEMPSLVTAISKISLEVAGGELIQMEQMLASQAVALDALFHSLAQRAAVQKTAARFDALMVLAFKAQSGSRSTVCALTDLKFPRQTSFIRQTNVSQGPQQVNNHATEKPALAPAKKARAIVKQAPVQAIGMAPASDIIKPQVARSRARESLR